MNGSKPLLLETAAAVAALGGFALTLALQCAAADGTASLPARREADPEHHLEQGHGFIVSRTRRTVLAQPSLASQVVLRPGR